MLLWTNSTQITLLPQEKCPLNVVGIGRLTFALLRIKYTHGFILRTLLVQEKCHWNSVEMCRMTLVVLWANFTHRFLLITLLFPKKMSLELSGDV